VVPKERLLLLIANATTAAVVISAWAVPLGLLALAIWRVVGQRVKAIGAKILSW
jgi:hypothetical protein